MLVIGADPGSFKTGLCWVTSDGKCHFETVKCENRIPFRYGIFRDRLAGFLLELPEDPVAIAIEEPKQTIDRDDDAESVMGIVRTNGVYAVIAAEMDRLWPHAAVFPWAPRIWRHQGDRKKDVAYRMTQKYNVEFETDDDSDALGIADHAMALLVQRHGVDGMKLDSKR
jgi:Holliday junction resolvasome RuvABC endonuclease subunit